MVRWSSYHGIHSPTNLIPSYLRSQIPSIRPADLVSLVQYNCLPHSHSNHRLYPPHHPPSALSCTLFLPCEMPCPLLFLPAGNPRLPQGPATQSPENCPCYQRLGANL